MIQRTSDQRWFDQLVMELRLRQVHGSAIGDTVASAKELLGDTGQGAEETFGTARDYAEALELPAAPERAWVREALVPVTLSLLAFLLFNQAVVPWTRAEPMLVSVAQLAFLAAPVALIALLPLYLDAIVRHLWVCIVISCIGGAAGVLSAVTVPESRADAWLVTEPLPWLVGSALVMVTLSIIRTVRTPPTDDVEITDPSSATTESTEKGARTLTLVTNWLFPILTLAMLGLALVLR